ncbi:MAG: radical SAM protein [Candidatus Omnitrophica bacterium]|nr:radical SAM protein [Candidatus Omnitrophota bacterium]
MKIALVKPPGTYASWVKWSMLGISYISACLETDGFECKIFDADFKSWSESTLVSEVLKYDPGVIGFTAMTHDIMMAAAIARDLKAQLNIPVIIGGCHVTALPSRTLEEFPVFDYGIYGEGERTMSELMKLLSGHEHGLENIKGLVFRDAGRVTVNPPRPVLTEKEIDELPFPDFRQYYGTDKNALSGKDKYYITITGRGCPFRCVFCMRVLGSEVRRRSPQKVCDEIEFAVSAYGAHTINFADEIFLFNNSETRALLNMMIERRLPGKIKWTGLIRANFVTPELISLAKRAGCYHLEMGVESGDEEILKRIKKGITVEQVRKAVQIIKSSGITLNTYYILGHPGETKETLRKTVDLAIELNTDDIAVGLMVPYPGTEIYELAIEGKGGYRMLSGKWSDFDKYCSKVLEIEGLPYKELSRWQRDAFIGLYLRNGRYLDALKFLWKIRLALFFIFVKWLNGLKCLLTRQNRT